jgi:formylglycine-generating enzyme required for sulfatase activity
MGEAEDLLPKYAWCADDSPTRPPQVGLLRPPDNLPTRSRPVGLLRPNDLGLFDLHGNVWEWCQNRIEELTDIKNHQSEYKVDNNSIHSLRGGAFNYDPVMVRSAIGAGIVPAYRDDYGGFRPARTYR